MKKSNRVLGIVLVMLIVLLSLGSNASAQTKDSLVFGISAEPIGLDPADVIDVYSFMPILQVFDTLVREEKDGSLVPGLAESWTVSQDRKEIVFKLRENVKFHNGDVMTADDVEFSINKAIKSPKTAKITGAISKAVKMDNFSVKLVLKNPYEPIFSSLSRANASIVSKRAMEADPKIFGRRPVGTGPYKFVEWINGEKLVFERFDEYYRGKAPIKNLTFRIFTDTNTAVIALEKGEIDVLDSPSTGDRDNLKSNKGLAFHETASSMFIFLAFNNEKGIFSNEKLRLAVSHAIDRKMIIMGAADGIGVPLESPISPSAFGYPAEFKNNPYDLEKAKKLLAEAGYPNGFTVTLKCTENPTYSKPAEIIQEQLRQIGINVEMVVMEKGAFLADIYEKGDFEMCVWAIISMIPDADYTVYSRFHSKMFSGGNNFMRATIPGMDELLEKSRISESKKERLALYNTISEMVRDRAVMIPLYSGMNTICANAKLKGIAADAVQKYYVFDYSW